MGLFKGKRFDIAVNIQPPFISCFSELTFFHLVKATNRENELLPVILLTYFHESIFQITLQDPIHFNSNRGEERGSFSRSLHTAKNKQIEASTSHGRGLERQIKSNPI